MKVILILAVIMFLAVFAAYKFGGFESLDPADQVANIRQNVSAGMPWDKVVEIHTPRKVAAIKSDAMGGQAAPQDFDPATLKAAIAKGHYPEGFVFPYTFSGKDAVEIYFDSQGKVTDLVKPVTSSDILNGQLFTQ